MPIGTEPTTRPKPQILILLAVYNGAAHLAQQLDSYLDQTDTDWALLASDDNSLDDSRTILRDFAQRAEGHDITVITGPNRGAVGNFFHLLSLVPEGTELVALSDQDDVWHPGKLARARAALAQFPPDTPALYCAGSIICAADLTPIRRSPTFHRPPHFRNALVQSVGGGNTMMLNRAAIDLVRLAVAEARDAAVHDWWLYQIITACGGQVFRDPEPVLDYRQHAGNVIGANTTLRGQIYRMLFIMGRRFADWNDINLRGLHATRHRFTPEAKTVLDAYSAARSGPWLARLRALRASGVYRQHRKGTIALYIACLLGRL